MNIKQHVIHLVLSIVLAHTIVAHPSQEIDSAQKTANNRDDLNLLMPASKEDLWRKVRAGDTPVYYFSQWDNRATHTLENANERFLCAARQGAQPAAELALSDGASVNAVDNDGNTALHLVAQGIQAVMARFLIEQKADVNQANHEGETALHKALNGKNKILMTQLLLFAGANADIPNNSGWTVYALAAHIIAYRHDDSTMLTILNTATQKMRKPDFDRYVAIAALLGQKTR